MSLSHLTLREITSPSFQILHPSKTPKEIPELDLPLSTESLSLSKPIKSSFVIRGGSKDQPGKIKYSKLHKYVPSALQKPTTVALLVVQKDGSWTKICRRKVSTET